MGPLPQPVDRPSLVARLRVIYTRALAVYRIHWRTLLITALFVFVPAAVLEGLADEGTKLGFGSLPLKGALVALTAAGANTLAYNMYKGVATNASMRWHAGDDDLPLRDVLRDLPYGRLIVIDILLTAGTAIGTALLVVPGVLFATVFSLSPVLLEMERCTVGDALRRSWELVRRHFLLVLAVQLIVLVVVDVIEIGVYALGDKLISSASFFGSTLFLGVVTALIASMLVKPISALAVIELTQELRDEPAVVEGARLGLGEPA